MNELGKKVLGFAVMLAASAWLVAYAVAVVTPVLPFLAGASAIAGVLFVVRVVINRRNW